MRFEPKILPMSPTKSHVEIAISWYGKLSLMKLNLHKFKFKHLSLMYINFTLMLNVA